MSVCCDCCVLSGRGLCDEPITRPEESYRLCCVVECDLETSLMKRPWPTVGAAAPKNIQQTKPHLLLRPILYSSYWILIFSKRAPKIVKASGPTTPGSAP